MTQEITEGIIIKQQPFQEKDIIYTIFTELFGVLKVFKKNYSSSRSKNGTTPPSPLMLVELVFSKKTSGLHRCQELSILHANLKLRASLPILEGCCHLLEAIHTSQPLEKQANNLFHLLLAYLKDLPNHANISAIVSSFYLKILRYDGFLSLNSHCSICQAPLKRWFLADGEFFCSAHSPSYAISFSKEDIIKIHTLTYSKKMEEIEQTNVENNLKEQIFEWFQKNYNEARYSIKK